LGIEAKLCSDEMKEYSNKMKKINKILKIRNDENIPTGIVVGYVPVSNIAQIA
jgi:hypothetical protein